MAAAAFSDGRPTGLNGEVLTIAVSARHAAALRDAEQLRLIASVVGSALGRSITLHLTAMGSNGEPVLDDRQRRYQEAERHPLVQEILKRFEGDLTTRELVDLSTWLQRVAQERDAAKRPVRPALPSADLPTGSEEFSDA